MRRHGRRALIAARRARPSRALPTLVLVLGCVEDSSGASWPSADLVRFSGATLASGTVDPRDGELVRQGPSDEGHDWALAVADGDLLVGLPALGELQRYAGGAGDGEVLAEGAASEAFGAAVAARDGAWFVGAPLADADTAAAKAGAVTLGGAAAGTLSGTEAQGRFGSTLAACGDVDGDGVDELAVGAPWEADLAGRAYVVPLAADAARWTLAGAGADERFGDAVACGTDLLGGAEPDVVVGAPFGAGSASLDGEGYAQVWDAAALGTGAPAVTLVSGAGTAEAFGSALALCRLRADGPADLAVGAPLGADGAGVVYLWSGQTGLGAGAAAALSVTGEERDGRFGSTLVCADLDGDGLDELLVGAPGVDAPDGTNEVGALYVLGGLGSVSGTLTTAAATTRFTADRGFLRTGARFAAGDLDADGAADVVLLVRQKARSFE